METDHIKLVTENRKARHEYYIDDEIEAGIMLLGTEVKSLRTGRANLKDAYGKFKNGELYLYQMHISPYPYATYNDHEPLRIRKLLLNKAEIKRLYGKMKEKGFTLVPLKVYFKNGKAKVTIALARGKRKYDKRDSIKEKEMRRELDRAKKKRY